MNKKDRESYLVIIIENILGGLILVLGVISSGLRLGEQGGGELTNILQVMNILSSVLLPFFGTETWSVSLYKNIYIEYDRKFFDFL